MDGLALRVGLCCRNLGVAFEVAVTTAGEYEEHELGVGTWLNGESVYRVEGVADCA